MLFIEVLRCGRVIPADIRKTSLIDNYKKLADEDWRKFEEEGAIPTSTYTFDYVPKNCESCTHGELIPLNKPVITPNGVKCPVLILNPWSRIPAGWISIEVEENKKELK